MTKVTIISASIVVAGLTAFAQSPGKPAPAQTNQVQQTPATPLKPAAQQPVSTNQTNHASSTNAPSPVATSTNTPSATKASNVPSTIGHQITIIRGSDPASSGMSTDNVKLPPNGNGVDPVKSTAGTSKDWRSDSQGTHVIPPRPSSDNP